MVETDEREEGGMSKEQFQAAFRENFGFQPFLMPDGNELKIHPYQELIGLIPTVEKSISNHRATIMVLRERSPFFKTVRVLKDALKSFIDFFMDLPNRFKAESENPIVRMTFEGGPEPRKDLKKLTEQEKTLLERFYTYLKREEEIMTNFYLLDRDTHEEIKRLLPGLQQMIIQLEEKKQALIHDNVIEDHELQSEFELLVRDTRELISNQEWTKHAASGIRTFNRDIKHQKVALKKIKDNLIKIENEGIQGELAEDISQLKNIVSNIITSYQQIVAEEAQISGNVFELANQEKKIEDDISALIQKFEKLFNVNASYTSHIRAERGRRLGDSEAHGILKSHGENNDIHKGYNNIFNEALKDLKKLFSDESNFYQEINKEWEEIQNLRSTLNAVHTTDIPRAYTILAKILEIVEEETPPAPEA
mgnify:FL=1|jgi:hypothetical protein